jgi:hypothetical protein
MTNDERLLTLDELLVQMDCLNFHPIQFLFGTLQVNIDRCFN